MKHLYPRIITRKIYTLFFLLLSCYFVNAQTTPVSGTTTFSGVAPWGYAEYAHTNNATAGLQATNVQSTGWDIRGYSGATGEFIISGENWASSSDGGFIYFASVMGESSIVSLRFKANDGKLFDLNAVDLGYDVAGANINFTITGFRNNVMVMGASYQVTSFTSFGNGGGWKRGINVSGNSNFNGIDEFRITPNTPNVLSALDVDNINAVNFRTASFAQIVPGDIPPFNFGAFSKTIGGHVFAFTPAVDNWVDYNTGIGTEGFGGLYAYDYNTMDGTQETLSPPANYTFDLNSFQYISDRGPVNLAITLTFSDNSTDTKNYILNGNSTVQTFTGFTTQANDVKKILIVTDALVYFNNYEVNDIKTYTTLPLQWLQFTAAKQGEGVLLNWRTTAEMSTKDFVVEHSINGQQWNTIGIVTATGTTDTEQAYAFMHVTPVNGLNAYRLLQRDHDGRSSYSPVVSVNLKTVDQVQVYPNPVVNGNLQVKLPSPELVRVYSSAGLMVMEKKLPAGVSTVNISHLAKGLYTIKVKDNSMLVVVQ